MEGSTWTEQYYLEVDKKKRKKLLDEGLEQEGMTPENELRSKLWEVRYGQRAKETMEIDHYIRGWLTMGYMKRSTKRVFGRGRVDKEKAKVLSDWGADIVKEYGEIGEKIYYQELCNMTRLYLKLCQEDKTYSSVLLGLGRMKETSLVGKIAKDVYALAYDIPEQTGTTEDFRIFTKAATDTFYAVYPDSREVLERMISGTDE